MFVSGDIKSDGAAALFALYDATATGKRGAHGSLLADEAAAELLGVTVRTIERWRAALENSGHCVTTPEGRYARKRVGKAWHGEGFVMVPAIVVRALLTREIGPLAFRLWALWTNTRIESGSQAGSWRGLASIGKQLGRKVKTLRPARDELLEAALLRVDDFGPGRPCRYVPQFARAVTQRLGLTVRRARDAVHRVAGILRKPQLARPRTPTPDVGSTPIPNVGSAGRAARTNAQVGPVADASQVGRDLFESDLGSGGRAKRMSLAEWRARTGSQVIRT